ncbi:glutamate receptor 4-like isoform X2 [Actinia tenebrosa]|uniref:Glutamate receptor 4-like isoform X2 n=1 Tax=Actinia tenebrosa TaxID=6105 RepID=A0A6P8HFT8_ACTTE|nr:glutamate receptor 4-like isoform X2 [Actinia tenebrosa]
MVQATLPWMAWNFIFLLVLFQTASANAAPKTVYIASTSKHHDVLLEKSLISAINYINNNSSILPGTDIKFISNTTKSIKENLLDYVKLLSQLDVIAVIVNSRPESTLDILGSMLHIPMITKHEVHGHFPGNGTQAPNSDCLGPSSHDVRLAMVDILKKNDWTDILVIYDVQWRSQANAFISVLPPNTKYSKLTLEIDEEKALCDDTKRQLNSLHNAPVQAIALFCDSDLVASVMDQVHCVCSFRIEKPHTWLMADMVPSLPLAVQSSQIMLAFMPDVMDNQYTRYLTDDLRVDVTSIYNSSLFAFDATLVTAHALESLINKRLWVGDDNTPSKTGLTISANGPQLHQQIKELTINSTTGIISFGNDGTRRQMRLEVLNLQENRFINVGTWDSMNKLKLTKKIVQNRPTSELIPLDKLNRRLKVVVVVDPPFVMRNNEGKLEGYSIDLIDLIAKKLNFRYDIYLAPDGLYGGRADGGRYNGIVGQLTQGLADLSTSPLTINSERLQIVEFSKPFMQFTMSLITKKLDFDNQDLMAFMMPYSSTVWFLTLACLVVVTGLMYVVNYISPYGYRHSKSAKNGEAFNLFNSLWFCLASMLQQGADNTPRSLSGRVLAGCFWFFILIWISTYTANLAAFFTVRNARKPVSTLEEVVDGDHHFYIIRDTAIHQFFRVASYQTYRKLYERVNAQNTFVNSTSAGYGVARKKKNAVFMAEKPSTEYVIMQEPCDLTAASGLLGASSYGIAMPKHYPYARNISVAVLTLHETGVLDSLWRKWWDYRSQCPKEQSRSGTGKQIELSSMIGVYVVLATGGISSIVLVVGEIYWSKHGRYFKALFRNEFGSFGVAKANTHHAATNSVPVLRVQSVKTTDL